MYLRCFLDVRHGRTYNCNSATAWNPIIILVELHMHMLWLSRSLRFNLFSLEFQMATMYGESGRNSRLQLSTFPSERNETESYFGILYPHITFYSMKIILQKKYIRILVSTYESLYPSVPFWLLACCNIFHDIFMVGNM